jgi:hypothetical protein
VTPDNGQSTDNFDILVEYLKEFPEAPESDLLNLVSKEGLASAVDHCIVTLVTDKPELTYSLAPPVPEKAAPDPPQPQVQPARTKREEQPRQIVPIRKTTPRQGPVDDSETKEEEPDNAPADQLRREKYGLLGYLEQVKCADYWELLQVGFSQEEVLSARRQELIVAQVHPVTSRLLVASADERYSGQLKLRDFSEDLSYALGALYNRRHVVPPVTYSPVALTVLYDILPSVHTVSQN